MIVFVPVWMSEIVPTKNRGALVDLHAACYLAGCMTASWVGLGFYILTPHVFKAWRGPFGWSIVLHSVTVRHSPFLTRKLLR